MRRRQWRWWHDDGKWQKLMIDSHNERQWAKTKKNNTSQTQKQQWNQCCVRSEVVSGVSELYTISKEQKREAEHGEKRCDFLFHRTARALEHESCMWIGEKGQMRRNSNVGSSVARESRCSQQVSIVWKLILTVFVFRLFVAILEALFESLVLTRSS